MVRYQRGLREQKCMVPTYKFSFWSHMLSCAIFSILVALDAYSNMRSFCHCVSIETSKVLTPLAHLSLCAILSIAICRYMVLQNIMCCIYCCDYIFIDSSEIQTGTKKERINGSEC